MKKRWKEGAKELGYQLKRLNAVLGFDYNPGPVPNQLVPILEHVRELRVEKARLLQYVSLNLKELDDRYEEVKGILASIKKVEENRLYRK